MVKFSSQSVGKNYCANDFVEFCDLMRTDLICKVTVNIYKRKDIFISTHNKQDFCVLLQKVLVLPLWPNIEIEQQPVSVFDLPPLFFSRYLETVLYRDPTEVATTHNFVSQRDDSELNTDRVVRGTFLLD